jgi:hypothetical protein
MVTREGAAHYEDSDENDREDDSNDVSVAHVWHERIIN